MQSPAITMVTPSWKVLNPEDTQVHGVISKVTGDESYLAGAVKAQVGTALEIKGFALGITGFSGGFTAVKLENMAANLGTSSTTAKSGGLWSQLKGIFAFG